METLFVENLKVAGPTLLLIQLVCNLLVCNLLPGERLLHADLLLLLLRQYLNQVLRLLSPLLNLNQLLLQNLMASVALNSVLLMQILLFNKLNKNLTIAGFAEMNEKPWPMLVLKEPLLYICRP